MKEVAELSAHSWQHASTAATVAGGGRGPRLGPRRAPFRAAVQPLQTRLQAKTGAAEEAYQTAVYPLVSRSKPSHLNRRGFGRASVARTMKEAEAGGGCFGCLLGAAVRLLLGGSSAWRGWLYRGWLGGGGSWGSAAGATSAGATAGGAGAGSISGGARRLTGDVGGPVLLLGGVVRVT